jgi:hypothetical protein
MHAFSTCLIAFGFAGAAFVGGAWPATAGAQEQAVADLTLRKTYMKTVGSQLVLDVAERAAFTPTVVTCSGGGTCTLRIELSAFIYTVTGVVGARVLVDGQVVDVNEMDYNVQPSQAGVRSFAWMREGVMPGNHIVEVRLTRSPALDDGTQAQHRILTVSVFK